jgi:hypothetical protein
LTNNADRSGAHGKANGDFPLAYFGNIASGLRSLFRKDQVSQELDEELNGFLEMAAEEKMTQGMSRKDALRAVRLERGNLEVAKETVRAASWESFVETCWRDVRFGLRTLYKAFRKALLKGNAYTFKELAERAFGKIKETHESRGFRPDERIPSDRPASTAAPPNMP